jgi:hypothetical protein
MEMNNIETQKLKVTKVKILEATTEKEINKFIADKDIISISFTPETAGHYRNSCFIVYKE